MYFYKPNKHYYFNIAKATRENEKQRNATVRPCPQPARREGSTSEEEYEVDA